MGLLFSIYMHTYGYGHKQYINPKKLTKRKSTQSKLLNDEATATEIYRLNQQNACLRKICEDRGNQLMVLLNRDVSQLRGDLIKLRQLANVYEDILGDD